MASNDASAAVPFHDPKTDSSFWTSKSTSKPRFAPLEFLPVLLVVYAASFLFAVHAFFHCVPAIQRNSSSGHAELAALLLLTGMFVWCYLRCFLTHPGSIPDGADWDFKSREFGVDTNPLNGSETKRTGDRRYCKWCLKYKPDRCHHCRVCRSCVLKMDHHCPWINNCVGFHNHKFFLLLVFYGALDAHLITWTMMSCVQEAVRDNVHFLRLFTVLFGESLAALFALLLTVFLGFHIWLSAKALTTIEFCEKANKKLSYETPRYDQGWRNISSVLGDNPLFWFVPLSPPHGDGLSFSSEASKLKGCDADQPSADARPDERANYGAAAVPGAV